ncbi:response regulator [Virgibacillus sediminis]|uniref:Response regulator n=1 Tax=Virgibacillus sediminis TaxID=202260 RepID=A0ABV7A876_9BACI
MSEKIQVLIVEDDFRIADIHARYVEKVNGFEVLGTVKTGEEALAFLAENDKKPDLILLDIYIPDVKGLDLLWQIRETYHEMDMIIVSAAKENEIIGEALRGGIFDYIVKPVDTERFEQSLKKYKEHKEFLASKETLAQGEVDLLIRSQTFLPAEASADGLPKGIDPITLKEIKTWLQSRSGEGVTAKELGEQIGTSRSTARRYLEFLVSTGFVRTTLKYGTVGRPERQYEYDETYEQNSQYGD